MKRVVFLLSLGAIAAISVPARAADDDNPVFRSDVALVRVDAQVLDRDNRAVTGLRVDDFLLREQGKPQIIRNFASENMPLDVLLLFDVSGSMRPHIQRIASAAHEAFRVLGPEDRVAIMVFDRATRVRSSFRKNRTEVERELDRMLQQESFRGGTDITRALYDSADYIRREGRRDARRAVVIVTDDQTEFNRDEAGVSRAFERADAVLSALIAPDMSGRYGGSRYPGNGGGGPGVGGGGPLGGVIFGRRNPYPSGGGGRGPNSAGGHTQSAGTSQIARDSGGDSMSVDDAYGLQTTLQRLRQRYALYFYLPTGVRPGEERSITVDLADAANRRYPGAEVRYRRVYLSPDGSKSSGDSNVITRRQSAPGSDSGDSDGPPTLRRRPAVSDASNDGPRVSIIGAAPPPAHPTPESAPAAPAPAAAAVPPPPATPRRGWRRVTDSDDTNGPITPPDQKPAESSKPSKPDGQ